MQDRYDLAHAVHLAWSLLILDLIHPPPPIAPPCFLRALDDALKIGAVKYLQTSKETLYGSTI